MKKTHGETGRPKEEEGNKKENWERIRKEGEVKEEGERGKDNEYEEEELRDRVKNRTTDC